MSSIRNPGRSAGLIYLLIVLLAPLRLIYIPGRLFIHGNAAVTASNIAAHQMLFRFGIVADLVTGTLMIFLLLALYSLLKGVDKGRAVLMLILGGVLPAALYFVNALNDAAVLVVLHGEDFLAPFTQPQREAIVTFFLRLHVQGVLVSEVFWGLWLLPLAALVYKSRIVPRFFAYWLFLNGIAYVVESFIGIALPQFEDRVSSVLSPVLFGEIAFMLWLMVRGARPPATTDSIR